MEQRVRGKRVSWAAAAGIGLVGDLVLGEPPPHLHPVALFGRAMAGLERRLYRDDRAHGVLHCVVGVGAAAGFGAVLDRLLGWRATVLAVSACSAGRMLGDCALEVGAALEAGQLERARELLPSLVGRDPRSLDEAEIARAVVESVAENSVDAMVAPVLWGAFAGAAGALGHRAANTLDAMVGHHNSRYERFGWASARTDDVAAWLPARLGVALVIVVRPWRSGPIVRAVRSQAGGHPSPNAGVIEAAFACALGVRLGGTSRYGDVVEIRPFLGEGRPAATADIARSVRLLRHVGYALTLGGLGLSTLRRRRRS